MAGDEWDRGAVVAECRIWKPLNSQSEKETAGAPMKSRINGGNTNGLSDGRKEGSVKQVGKTREMDSHQWPSEV